MDAVMFAPISVNRRAAVAGKLSFKHMTMASLIAWRATCRDNHLLVTKEFRESLHTLLARFFPNPHALLKFVTSWGALLVGEVALAHTLHDPSFCNSTVEIAVGNLAFETFVHRLTRLLPFGTNVLSLIEKPSPSSFPSHRHISRIAEFQLTNGLTVQVYESSTPSACDVVCGFWTTALMNFVTEFSIGCAYPRLTLNFRGFLCESRMGARRWTDHATHIQLHARGFELAPYSSSWSSFSAGPYSASPPVSTCCGRALHICPSQGRFFGDAGSLVVFFDGFFVRSEDLRRFGVPPFGPMVAWRIPVMTQCSGQCVENDSVLPPLVVSVIIRFVPDISMYSTQPASLSSHLGMRDMTSLVENTTTARCRRGSV